MECTALVPYRARPASKVWSLPDGPCQLVLDFLDGEDLDNLQSVTKVKVHGAMARFLRQRVRIYRQPRMLFVSTAGTNITAGTVTVLDEKDGPIEAQKQEYFRGPFHSVHNRGPRYVFNESWQAQDAWLSPPPDLRLYLPPDFDVRRHMSGFGGVTYPP